MAEVQWIKIIPELFDDDKIQLIENMPEGDTILVIWFKLLCFAGKKNNGGVFTLGDKKPYTAEMFATIFHRPVSTIELALDTFESFGMVEKIKGTFTIANWEKHQNVDKMDEIREYNKLKQRESRAKRKLLQSVNDNVIDTSMTSQSCQDIEEEKDKDKDKDKDKELRAVIPSMRDDENQLKCLGGIGKYVVYLSDKQTALLLERLGLEGFDYYVERLAKFIIKNKANIHNHCEMILKWAAEDSKLPKGYKASPKKFHGGNEYSDYVDELIKNNETEGGT